MTFHKYANPKLFLNFLDKLWVLCVVLFFCCLIPGLYYSLLASPPDYQQGETVRLMYIHVPAAWMGMMVYAMMGLGALSGYIWRHPVADVLSYALAPIGLIFTGLTLITGMIWGKPMWGAPWVWDARLTSVLVLFFLYVGYVVLVGSHTRKLKGIETARPLILIGLINLPIIKFSVEWWNTLHQPASLLRFSGPSIAPEMLLPLFLMGGAYFFLMCLMMILNFKAVYYSILLEQHQLFEMRRKA